MPESDSMHHCGNAPPVTPAMTVRQAIAQAQAQGLDRLDAQMLVLHALQRPLHDRAWLVTHDADLLEASALNQWQAHTTRRVAGEPLAYITGHKEFCGLDLAVDARVLVPRPETETLVQWTLDILDNGTQQVLDLGTGSGAIALALKHARPRWNVSAVDASQDALAVARANAERLQLAVNFWHGDWLTAADPHIQFDAIVSNPPYINAGDPHLDALTHEPLAALTSGTDGLDDIRRIIQQSPDFLKTGGWLLLEHGYDQGAAVRALLSQSGYTDAQSRRDLAGIERCSGARRMG